MLKKSIALILSVCMLFSLCACGSDKDEKKTKKSETKSESFQENLTDVKEETTSETVKPEEKLSSTCSMVLCTGVEGNNYYELVANQIDGYPDSTFEFGVIKNNQWLVPMGTDCPFIDENGWWLGASNVNKPCKFEYIGAGCFYYAFDGNYGKNVLYKPETGINMNVFRLYSIPDSGKRAINDEAEIIVHLYDKESTIHSLVYKNMNTGETKNIQLCRPYDIAIMGIISEGLFLATVSEFLEEDERGFYDLNGNQVIDLSTYNIVDFKDRKFTNGQYTFTAINNSNIRFNITIDTTGKVISQEKEQA